MFDAQDTTATDFNGTAIPPAISLGELIAGRRRDLGLSQRDLADAVCRASGRVTVTRHEISRYERETRLPAATAAPALAAALGLPEAALRRAAGFARTRRWLAAGDTGLRAALLPGFLLDADPARGPQPMFLMGTAVDAPR